MRKKLKIVFGILFVLSIVTYIVFKFNIPSYLSKFGASVSETNSNKLEIVAGEKTKNLDGDVGTIKKTITSIDQDKGEVVIDLSFIPGSKQSSSTTPTTGDNYEIAIVIDDSGSMDDSVGDGTRKDVVRSATKTLVEKVLNQYSNVSFSITSFAAEASVDSTMTSDKTTLINAINNGAYVGGVTNIELGLITANGTFTNNQNTNRVLILLTDGLPNYCECDDSVDVCTLSKMQELENSGVLIINLLTGLRDNSYYSDEIEEIFGTEANPTVGKFYNIDDTDIETIISENIFADIEDIISIPNQFKNVSLVDYFPEEILDNFTFEYVTKPTTGTISNNMENDNTIRYSNSLVNKQVTITYKLTAKNMNNDSLLGKVLKTNEKVVLDYNYEEADKQAILLGGPEIRFVKKPVPCDITLTSDKYKIDEEKLIVGPVNDTESNDTIKNNVKASDGEITIDGDKLTAKNSICSKTYTINKVWMPKTGKYISKYGPIFITLFGLIMFSVTYIKFPAKNKEM